MLRRLLLPLLVLGLLAAPDRPAGVAAQGDDFRYFLPLQARGAPTNAAPQAHIAAFVPDGLAANDADEAVAIQNTGRIWMTLQGWQLSDGEGMVTLPHLPLPPGALAWCTLQATAFRHIWGFTAACEYGGDSDPAVPDAGGTAPRLANTGDEIVLLAPGGRLADAVVFAAGNATIAGWQGAAVPYYQGATLFARAGQVFYRLFDPLTRLPLPDTDTAADWAQGNTDPARGRRAAYPGWDLYAFSLPAHVAWQKPPAARLLVTPDNAFAAIEALLASASTSILIEAYEFDHPDLVAILVERAQAGVTVRLLLEGAPTGGLSDQVRWAARQISAAGGQVHFMVNDLPGAFDRYPFIHAKFAVIDDATVVVSSENFKTSSMPARPIAGETWGRRGYVLVVADPILAARASAVFHADANPAHNDIFSFQSGHPTYGDPPSGFTPVSEERGGYRIRHPQALDFADARQGYLFTSPEGSLSPGPLLNLIARAGPGDRILAQQLYEHRHWGAAQSNPTIDPNPRLQAMVAAARRGAQVRLLLDSLFDDRSSARSNQATAAYVNAIAQAEGLDLRALTGNPAGGGLHGKLFLLALGHERWVLIGSLNGGEVSHKLNRELTLALDSAAAFQHAAEVFWQDWAAALP